MDDASNSPLELTVDAGRASIHLKLFGNGPLTVMLPSLGRGAADFTKIAQGLARAGHCVACPEPRGIGKSTGPLEGLTQHDLANDVAALIRALGDGPATVVGHAFGNRIARTTAADHPELVRGIVLLAAGGAIPPSERAAQALRATFDESLSPEDHLEAVRIAFFAKGNDPLCWADGWHTKVSLAQRAAGAATPIEHWWTAGNAPLLVVQGSEDVIAPPRNGELLAEMLGERVTLVGLPKAGHALLPEQPEAITGELLRWLATLP